MSLTFSLEGVGNTASHDFYPPIELNSRYNYVIGLIGFYGCNSIRNIHSGNDKLYYKDAAASSLENAKVVNIPHGAYELDELSAYLSSQIEGKDAFILKANNNTLKCELKSTYMIDFSRKDNIGRMLGFSAKRLKPNVLHTSDMDIQIMKNVNIHVECNIIRGSFRNGHPAKTIYEIDISVPPGYRLDKIPSNPTYFAINTEIIRNITIRLTNQHGEVIDFGADEPFTVRLELRKDGLKDY